MAVSRDGLVLSVSLGVNRYFNWGEVPIGAKGVDGLSGESVCPRGNLSKARGHESVQAAFIHG